jgi:hypothetical protein
MLIAILKPASQASSILGVASLTTMPGDKVGCSETFEGDGENDRGEQALYNSKGCRLPSAFPLDRLSSFAGGAELAEPDAADCWASFDCLLRVAAMSTICANDG